MRFTTVLFPVLLAGSRMLAGPIQPVPADVSTATTQWLNPTDKLLFTVTASSYSSQASRRGLPVYPSAIRFQFVSLPETAPGEFAAWWQSPDGSAIEEFPETFSWLPGWIQSSGYTGPVSLLDGSLRLSPTAAQELLGGGSAVLVLENLAGPVRVGLSSRTLAQDLTASFSNNGLGVGGRVTQVQYLDPPPVPEPPSGVLLLLIGPVICCLGGILNRIAQRDVQ